MIASLVLVTVLVPADNEREIPGADQPESQSAFLEIVRRAETEVEQAPNSLAREDALALRDSALARDPNVSNWLGTVLGVQEMLGRGAIVIDANGAEAIAGVHDPHNLDTLISPSEERLYSQILTLQAGDKVVFSGEFVIQDGSLVEISHTQPGATSSPRFLFRFSEITSAN